MEVTGIIFGDAAQQLIGVMCFATLGLVFALTTLYCVCYFTAYVLNASGFGRRR